MNKITKRKLTNFAIGIFSIIASFFTSLVSVGLTNNLIVTLLKCQKTYFQGDIDFHSCPLIRGYWIFAVWLVYFIIWFMIITLLFNKIYAKR